MRNYITFIFLSFSTLGFSQESLSELLKQNNEQSVPYISVQELAMPKTKAILLDAREQKEYNVSHLENAIYVGYDFFDLKSVTDTVPDKNQEIVVYCSLGIRSEDIAEQLKKEGYKNVRNLYGGIFEWKNNNFKVYNQKQQITDSVHAFSKEWSKWLKKGNAILD
ncbi:MAG: rhodanese-like domain-containing protein [Winogradskyella sp.]|nr:MAG: rhodanese-like domain-containing protein [Winogradskyella sp.]